MSHKQEMGREQKILLAAMQEFNEKGVYGARMQEIATRAGVNKALLHYYFRSKDQLYVKVLEAIAVPFWQKMEKGMAELRDENDFRGIVLLIAEIIVDSTVNLPYSSILLMEFASGGRYLEKMDSRLVGKIIQAQSAVLSFFAGLIERKIIKPFNPLTVFVNILGMCWNIFLAEPFTTPVLLSMGVSRDEKYFMECIDSIVEMATAGMLCQESQKDGGAK